MRTERFVDGVLVEIVELIDVAGTVTFRHTLNGVVVEERAATTIEQADYTATVKQQRIDTVNDQFAGGVKTLRLWATQAQGTTVTNTNAVATLQIVIDRLGLFFDRFADLLVLLDKADIDDFD